MSSTISLDEWIGGKKSPTFLEREFSYFSFIEWLRDLKRYVTLRRSIKIKIELRANKNFLFEPNDFFCESDWKSISPPVPCTLTKMQSYICCVSATCPFPFVNGILPMAIRISTVISLSIFVHFQTMFLCKFHFLQFKTIHKDFFF